MLGGMLQFDSVAGDLSGVAGEIRGSGWMAGPYFVANGVSGQLRFEGRLLYGRSSSDISGFASRANRPARDGSFDSERWLALAGIEEEYRLKNGAVVLPTADLAHAREIAEGFRDSLGREVESQKAALTRLRLGATFEIPVEAARGDLTLRPGLRFVTTEEDGGLYGESGVGAAGRIDFGVDYRIERNVALEFDGFYSGIGRRDRESYGAGAGLRMDFKRACSLWGSSRMELLFPLRAGTVAISRDVSGGNPALLIGDLEFVLSNLRSEAPGKTHGIFRQSRLRRRARLPPD